MGQNPTAQSCLYSNCRANREDQRVRLYNPKITILQGGRFPHNQAFFEFSTNKKGQENESDAKSGFGE